MINTLKRQERQEECKEKIIESNYDGIVEVCPRFGKTKVVLEAIKDFEGDVYISSPYTDIRKNWVVEKNKWNIEKRFVALCHKSLASIPSNLSLLVLDEAQALSVNNLKTIAAKKPQKILLLSGYLGEESRRYINYWLGKKEDVYTYSIEQAVEEKIISDFRVKVILLELNTKVAYYRDGASILTEKEAYDRYTRSFERFKQKEKEDFSFNKLKELFARKRRTFIATSGTKIQAAKRLAEMMGDERRIIFTAFNEVADTISNFPYHSKSKSLGNLTRFQQQTINELCVCNMVSMGITLPNLKRAILHQAISNSEMSVQKILRVCNIDTEDRMAYAYILGYKDTVEEDWIRESLMGIPESKIEYLTDRKQIEDSLK